MDLNAPIAFGTVDADGNLDGNASNFRVAKSGRSGEGRYWIEFLPGTFSENPAVVATVAATNNAGGQNGTNRTISVTFLSTVRVEIGIRKASSDKVEDSNRPFSFIAIGQPG